jgi:small subunit ribosomal protein S6
MSPARQYELVYIVSPDATDQDVADLHAQIEAIVVRYQGEMIRTDTWGRRKLAFRIGRHREGIYVLEVFKGTGELTKELDRRLKVIDSVIRHLIVRVDEDLRLAERTRARREAEVQRRIARGLPVGGRPRRTDEDGAEEEPNERAEV